MKPTDGGRGSEFRTRWGLLRLFSWRHGFAVYRFPRSSLHCRWAAFPLDAVLFGVEVYEDEDGERAVNVGCWPVRMEFGRLTGMRGRPDQGGEQ